MATDKVVIANRTAMHAQYGIAGVQAIDAALAKLIAADLKRGIKTDVVDISHSGEMTGFGGFAVVAPTDERGAKQAVDAICGRLNPDYVMLLGGPDIVPHIALDRIRGVTDSDATTESDLPYASPAPFSRSAQRYLNVTRVVSRLPTPRGTATADALVILLDASAAHVTRPAGDLIDFFSITADSWLASTQLSLNSVFGRHQGLYIAPQDGHQTIDPDLKRLPHFINCHGAQNDWRFYGEKNGVFPVAMESALTEPHVGPGTVVAAECCYGAELYDHTINGWQQPICMSYLLKGAAAFMGSTNIAYGPAASNGQADLICQSFLENVLAGASVGRAMLQARQHFVSTQAMSTPVNLKTLAQFVLYGDPSLHVTLPASDGSQEEDDDAFAALSDEVDGKIARKARRMALDSDGRAIASAATFAGTPADVPAETERRLREIARSHHFVIEPKVYHVSGGSGFRATAKRLGRERKVAIAVERAETPFRTDTGVELPSYRAFVAHIMDDGLTRVEISESR
ncbi:C25 family cysteine peptidase [Jiella pacifica]|uniref:Gingipain domain-containing protein n=1 Tax=Jiella pacifica TaxID=2696469 RepID=A0A6N9SVA6_9HYPH|nr:C25 family cysteine peptidase [Jiella pacifica]NDW02934.1 hypothetical protein [Jiella pacifica]